MGTWGSGNFESDEANRYLDRIVAQLVADINERLSSSKLSDSTFLENSGEYHVIPAIDVYITLSTAYDISPLIELATAKTWKFLYLQAFDKDDSMFPKKFKAERRLAIEETFNRLEKLIIEWDE